MPLPGWYAARIEGLYSAGVLPTDHLLVEQAAKEVLASSGADEPAHSRSIVAKRGPAASEATFSGRREQAAAHAGRNKKDEDNYLATVAKLGPAVSSASCSIFPSA